MRQQESRPVHFFLSRIPSAETTGRAEFVRDANYLRFVAYADRLCHPFRRIGKTSFRGRQATRFAEHFHSHLVAPFGRIIKCHIAKSVSALSSAGSRIHIFFRFPSRRCWQCTVESHCRRQCARKPRFYAGGTSGTVSALNSNKWYRISASINDTDQTFSGFLTPFGEASIPFAGLLFPDVRWAKFLDQEPTEAKIHVGGDAGGGTWRSRSSERRP